MQVTAAPVSKSHEKVLSPALTASLGLILNQETCFTILVYSDGFRT
jgi:hypothetical protein